MRAGIAIGAAAAAALAVTLSLLLVRGDDSRTAGRLQAAPGEPSVDIVSPRNGARQGSRAVVVKVEIRNFRLAPHRFGGEPQLGEGSIRFSLNKVPDCVKPEKLARALANPLGRGRLVGPSFDYARYAGPNGVLAERIGEDGSYSPATRPEIYYHDLRPGFYRLVVTLAQNDGSPTAYHDVTNLEILRPPGASPHRCGGGKVPAAKAAALE